MDCEAIAEHSLEGGPADWESSKRAMVGFCETLIKYNLAATLFAVPLLAEKQHSLLHDLEKAGMEVGLHFHPQDHGYEDYLGGFNEKEQLEMLSKACEQWSQGMGRYPKSFRSGNFSGNDYTFPVLSKLGFEHGSISCPDRNFTRLRANWKGAPYYPHHANGANRLIAGDMDFLEVPITVDPESIMWGGLTPLELRLEMVDARAHGFTIRKSVEKQFAEKVELPTIVPITHNTFDYSNLDDFRSQVLTGMIEEMKKCAELNQMMIKGSTLNEFHNDYEMLMSSVDKEGK